MQLKMSINGSNLVRYSREITNQIYERLSKIHGLFILGENCAENGVILLYFEITIYQILSTFYSNRNPIFF